MNLPSVSINVGQGSNGIGSSLGVFLLITLLTLAPSIIIMLTSFTRIIVVLGFVRTALGFPQLPPNQVLTGLALFLTIFTMTPELTAINAQAVQPLLANRITQQEALDARTGADPHVHVHPGTRDRPRAHDLRRTPAAATDTRRRPDDGADPRVHSLRAAHGL